MEVPRKRASKKIPTSPANEHPAKPADVAQLPIPSHVQQKQPSVWEIDSKNNRGKYCEKSKNEYGLLTAQLQLTHKFKYEHIQKLFCWLDAGRAAYQGNQNYEGVDAASD